MAKVIYDIWSLDSISGMESCETQRNLAISSWVAGGEAIHREIFPEIHRHEWRCGDIFGARVRIVYRTYDRLGREVTRVKRKSTYLATGDLTSMRPTKLLALEPATEINHLWKRFKKCVNESPLFKDSKFFISRRHR